jgi:4-hydroxy-tetrahydrodipicolinate reductase
MLGIVVAGVGGRMGQTIARLVAEAEDLVLLGATEAKEHPICGSSLEKMGIPASCSVESSLDNALALCEGELPVVVIDFTLPKATLKNAKVASSRGVPMVVGTTGFSKEEAENLTGMLEKIPAVWAPNMSVGVNLLFNLVEKVATILDDEYDVEIVETHHRFKKDAPSGTALRLAERIAKGRGVDLDDVGVFGRKGITGERKRGEIGVMALRAGDVVGEHTVTFATLGERVELVHKAHSRETFARGAIKAARWVADKDPGIYGMDQVLGLK